MKRLIVALAPLALVACGAPEPEKPKEPPPIVEAPRREAAPPSPPQETPAPAPAPVPAAPAPPTVIDLGGPPTAAPPPATPSPAAPAAPDATRPDAAAIALSNRLERERREKRVSDAEARIAELEGRLLAISNPFLPRPKLPPDEAMAWEGLDGVQRRERVQKQLEEANRELEAARKDLEALGDR